jgi:hypothetical protein
MPSYDIERLHSPALKFCSNRSGAPFMNLPSAGMVYHYMCPCPVDFSIYIYIVSILMVKVSIQNSLSILLQRAQSERAQCRRHAHSACTRPLCRDCACHDCGEVPLANLSFLLSFNLPRLFLSGHRLCYLSFCLFLSALSLFLPAC